MGINLGCDDGAVSQNLLYVSDVNILLQKHGRKGMSEHVGSNMLGHACQLGVMLDHVAHRLLGKPLPQPVDKKIFTIDKLILKEGEIMLQSV